MTECNHLSPSMYSTYQTTISRKFRLFSVYFRSMFARFCVDLSSLFWRCLLGFLSILCPYSFRIIARVHMNKHNPTLRLRIRPTRSVPTYCIVPLIVSRLNAIICNQACTVIYNTMIISYDHINPRFREITVYFVLIFCRCLLGFVSIFRLFSVDVCVVF